MLSMIHNKNFKMECLNLNFLNFFRDIVTVHNVISYFGLDTIKSIFIGSIIGLIVVYFIRFYSLASNGIKSGYLKISYSIDESAYLLGYSKLKTFKNIHIPYLKNSMLFYSPHT